MIEFTGRKENGEMRVFPTLAEAEAFVAESHGEYLEANPATGLAGVFGYNPEAPCCEGPCTHEKYHG